MPDSGNRGGCGVHSADQRLSSWILLVICVIHALAVFTFYPPSELLREEPIYNDDYSTHFYRAKVVREIFQQSGQIWGYNPYLMAGHPASTILAVDNRVLELIVSMAPVRPLLLGKLFIVLGFLVVPVAVYGAARLYSLPSGECVVAAGLGVLFWWMNPLVHGNMITFGMYAFGICSYLCLPMAAIFHRYAQQPSALLFACLSLLGSFLLLLHVFAPVILVAACVTSYYLCLKRQPWQIHLSIFLVAAVVLAVNSFSLYPVFLYQDHYQMEATAIFFHNESFLTPLAMYLAPIRAAGLTSSIDTVIFGFAIYGLYRLKREQQQVLFYVFSMTLLFLFVLSFYGSFLPLANKLQPMRFLAPLGFFMTLPAAHGLARSAVIIGRSRKNPESFVVYALLIVLTLPRLTDPLLFVLRTDHPLDVHKLKYYQRVEDFRFLTSSLPEEANRVMRWLERNTSREGRILVEDSCFESGHRYFGAHGVVLPYHLDREFVMGDHAHIAIDYHFAEFTNGRLFKRDIETFQLADLTAYLDSYNICWIVTYSERSMAYFQRFSEYVVPVANVEGFQMYRINRAPDYFLEGSGKVTADFNEIRVSDASVGTVVLKYHWAKTLRADPAMEIEPAPVLDDPVGFIRVQNGDRESFRIYNAYD